MKFSFGPATDRCGNPRLPAQWFRILSYLLALIAAGIHPAFAEGSASPKLVLIEHSPWHDVIGSESPTFALYVDGLVLFRDPNNSGKFLSVRLSPDAYRRLVRQLAPESLLGLSETYSLSQVTDQSTTEIYAWVKTRKHVSVYGDLSPNRADRRAAPPAFLRIFDAAASFAAKGQPWLPERIEVLLWPYNYSPDAPVAWPSNWPELSEARKRGTDGLRQLFIPSHDYERLRKLIKSLRPKQAVAMGGHKWAISFRLPFPNEQDWSTQTKPTPQ